MVPKPKLVTLGFRDPQRLGTVGDRWGVTAVSKFKETAKKQPAAKPPPAERRQLPGCTSSS